MRVGDLENRLSKHFYRTQLHMKSKSLITDELFYIVKSELMGPLVTMFKMVILLCILNEFTGYMQDTWYSSRDIDKRSKM